MTTRHPQRPQASFCVTADRVISWQHFASDVARVRPALAGHDAICIMEGCRYPFSVLLAAALLNGQSTVLPPARAAGAVDQALVDFENPLVVADVAVLVDRLPSAVSALGPSSVYSLNEATGDLEISTSGSTGLPVKHRKSWKMLEHGARLTAEIIERAGLSPGSCLVAGTTPHQHMYGLEAAVFTGLAHGHVLYDAPVFYPADLEALDERAAQADLQAIVLITSPPHLKFLAEKIRDLPRIRCVVSATAPLSDDLAAEIDNDCGDAQVYEIYGSTETGSLAWRRTVVDDLWTPLEGFQLLQGPDGWRAAAPHLSEITPLSDEIDLRPDGRFRLGGRRGDMVQIAGKRHNLGALNAILAALPMIADGAVLRETVAGEDRLHMFIVPKTSDIDREDLSAKVRSGLRATLDGVFVPRRIHIVENLPRNETGKISARDAAILIATGGRSSKTREQIQQIASPKSR